MASPQELQAAAELASSVKVIGAAVGGTGVLSSLGTLLTAKYVFGFSRGEGNECQASAALTPLVGKIDEMVSHQKTANKLLELLVQKEMQGG
jgi:hypothetical protein